MVLKYRRRANPTELWNNHIGKNPSPFTEYPSTIYRLLFHRSPTHLPYILSGTSIPNNFIADSIIFPAKPESSKRKLMRFSSVSFKIGMFW